MTCLQPPFFNCKFACLSVYCSCCKRVLLISTITLVLLPSRAGRAATPSRSQKWLSLATDAHWPHTLRPHASFPVNYPVPSTGVWLRPGVRVQGGLKQLIWQVPIISFAWRHSKHSPSFPVNNPVLSTGVWLTPVVRVQGGLEGLIRQVSIISFAWRRSQHPRSRTVNPVQSVTW
jgi:hypothetical protein